MDEKAVRCLLDPHYRSKFPPIAQAIKLLGVRLVCRFTNCLFWLMVASVLDALTQAG